MLIGSGRCPFCGKDNRVDATPFEMEGYKKLGKLCIQDAMPNLSAEKREIIISGICLACQKKIFSSDESDCDDEENDEPDDADVDDSEEHEDDDDEENYAEDDLPF